MGGGGGRGRGGEEKSMKSMKSDPLSIFRPPMHYRIMLHGTNVAVWSQRPFTDFLMDPV